MKLEILMARLQEIEQAIVNVASQLNALHGHKAEINHWISELQKPAPEENENQVEKVKEPVAE